ncbi:MAG: phosphonate C-P lyase system protein PhnG [Sphingomonadaceae bacterium]
MKIGNLLGMTMESADKVVDEGEVVTGQRQRAHALIAKSDAARVRALFDTLETPPTRQAVRPSDIGLLMVRGRVGGSGGAFNLGELPVARAAVRLASGAVGVGYVAGRDTGHAELAALADAMVQSPDWRALVEDHILAPLEAEHAHRQIEAGRKAAATKVDFFTLVRTRGEP